MNVIFLIRRVLIGRQTLKQLASEPGKSCSKSGGLVFFDALTIFSLKDTVSFKNRKQPNSRKVQGWPVFSLFPCMSVV